MPPVDHQKVYVRLAIEDLARRFSIGRRGGDFAAGRQSALRGTPPEAQPAAQGRQTG